MKQGSFRDGLRTDMERFVEEQSHRFPKEDCLRIDLHCHDFNSDVPDEIIGRMTRSRETWLETKTLISALKRSGMDLFTVTNHNNARSCWALKEQGHDVLAAAEFTCFVPDFEVYIHVLTYGFSPQQEEHLRRLRGNLYEFLEFANWNQIPTAWAHPLYVYGMSGLPPMAFWEKLTVVFQRFEVLNGHRDTWQNLLFKTWLESLDLQKIEEMAERSGVAAGEFCSRPYEKDMLGGSDCHMGLFVGSCGSHLYVPNLRELREHTSLESLARQALWTGRVAPFGRYSDERRIAAALLDYYCQAQMNLEDAGLIRLLLHRGTASQKLVAYAFTNAVLELRRHKMTSRFIKAAHGALHGKSPGFVTKWVSNRSVRPVIHELEHIASSRRAGPIEFEEAVIEGIPKVQRHLASLFAQRLTTKVEKLTGAASIAEGKSAAELIEDFEIPMHFRAMLGSGSDSKSKQRTKQNLSEWMDGLPFPALATALLVTSQFSAAKTMFGSRPILQEFSERVGAYQHPERALWLTDTLYDKNGVSRAVHSALDACQERDLPIDFLTSFDTKDTVAHLHTLPPLGEFSTPIYADQDLRMFDLVEVQRRFVEGGYDRVICSTEFLMGPVALYLKHAFHVPAYFYLHTDWIQFAEDALGFDSRQTDRLRRILRTFYLQFDGIFVLNSEQAEWLSSEAMGIPQEKIFRTGHWADPVFQPKPVAREAVIPGLRENELAVIYAGRISKEKGILDIVEAIEKVKIGQPNVRLVLAGVGPELEAIRELVPDAILMGWVSKEQLADLYCASDVFVLASRFDTFCCSLLEAMSAGLPCVAYSAKGPKDIVQHEGTGYLVHDVDEMAMKLGKILANEKLRARMAQNAVRRAKEYSPKAIMDQLLLDIGLSESRTGVGSSPEELSA